MHLFFVEEGAGVYDSVQLGDNAQAVNPRSFPQVFYAEDNQVWGAVRFGPSSATTSVTSDCTASYAIITKISADCAASYALRAAVSADAVASYNLLAAGVVTSDASAGYAIRAAVLADLAAVYAIGAGSMPTAAQIAAAVIAAMNATPPAVNLVQVQGQAITGTGSEADPWGP